MFPIRVEDQVIDLNEKNAYLKINAARFSLTSTDLTKLEATVAAVNAADAIANKKETRSELDVAKRKQAIEQAQTFVRKIIEYYVIGNANTTDVDYQALRIPKPGPHMPLDQPNDAPGIGYILCKDYIAKVPFFDAKTNRRGKAEGASEIETYYKKGGEPPHDFGEMSERKISTASPIQLRFDPKDDGETLYLVFRWVGTRGDYGPWSDIHKVIIIR
jgi:hypothetical protein